MTVVSLQNTSQSICNECPVKDIALCHYADSATRSELCRLLHNGSFSRGQSIIMQGDTAKTLGIVTSGVVKTVFMTEDGDTQVLGLLFPGDFVGRAFEPEMRFSYEAATDVTMCSVNRRSFESLLSRSPTLEHGYLVTTLAQMDAMRSWTCLLRGRTARQRVAAYLLYRSATEDTADAYVETIGDRLVLNLRLSRIDLASLLDMTPETFCRCLHALADQGAVHVCAPHLIEVLDSARLEDLAGPSLEGLVEYPQRAAG
ncbi:Crp/Fnr family transcriptional regulator [Roseobacter sp. AzwK-3b]|uniref:Crp/Fnr family transcriptional regulator n=1 Tax=Roseobacter sp. AzwK-3b TaxID=351016 RepID=UPI00257127B8|nr:Crp/Fnr family transcriptional regulator [Roseobacter sp. AzwK-3b]